MAADAPGGLDHIPPLGLQIADAGAFRAPVGRASGPARAEFEAYPSYMAQSKPTWTRELLTAPHDVPDKSARVRQMFNAIATRYELVNTVFSAGRDATWRLRAVKLCEVRPDDAVLDIACGTGDFARAFASAGAQTVVGCDFAHEMLLLAMKSRSGRCAETPKSRALWCEGDALRLPFASGSFSITSCAFGVRNFADLDAGLREMFRVLHAGGRAVILEFSRPKNRIARRLYEFYATRLMPIAATLASGDRTGAYRYLPQSVVSFVEPDEMCRRLRHAGFSRVTATRLTLGVVTVYVAARDQE